MTNRQETLPKGWRWASLGEVCEFLDSRRIPINEFDRRKRIAGKEQSELFPYYGANGQVGWIDSYIFDEPLILLAEDGGNFGSYDRPIAYAASGRYWVNNHAHVLRPRPVIDFDFCVAALSIRPDVGELVTGNTRPKLNQAVAATIPIPLPSLNEQQRIASILNEQMAVVEKARAAAKAQLDAARALPAAYLREVFESEEAKDWPKVTLGDISTLIQNGIYKSAENYGYGHPFLRMYNIANDSWKLTLESLAQVNLKDTELESFRLRVGDLLVSRVNSFELVGKCGWAGPEVENYVFENMLIRVRLTDAANSLFVAQQMQTRIIREQIEAVAKRAIGQSSINSTDLRGIQIVLPSLEIQRNVAKTLTEKVFAAKKTRQVLEAQLITIEQLPGALLRRAFSGELTRQLSIVLGKTLPLDIYLRQQAAIMIFNIKQMYEHPTFGHVKCEKMQFMAETYIGLELGGHYRRAQFGPYDEDTLKALEPLAEQQDWFRVIKPSGDTKKYSYELGAAAEELLQTAEAILGNQKAEMERVLKLFKPFHTIRVEMLVTLFAAWNDLLIEGRVPTDAQIIDEVRENWHLSKQKFTPQRLQVGLEWLRQNRLIPQGRGSRTSPNTGESHG